jgi:uncharacterized heparinase superfamily protein
MRDDAFFARARRALRRPPGYLARRALESARRRARRPWSSVAPRLLSDRALVRMSGAPSIDALWERQAQRPFFVRPSQREPWTAAFAARFPSSSAAAAIGAADAAVRHEFDLLGSGPTALGSRLPWHTDFKSGREWPLQYACDIEYNELDRPTDVKVPWELSRCQHFTALGQAYWLTGDERYAQEFVAEVDDWLDRNPWAYGVNWACAMDVALRAVSWLWAFYFFADAQACRSTRFRGRLLRALLLHGEYIATHLERSDVNGNHYLCDGVGLVCLGVFFGALERGRSWYDAGRAIVIEEIDRQTTTDGVDFEQATAYHRLVLEAFLTAYVLMRAAGDPVPDSAWSRLERMCEYVEAYSKPDGTVPLIGDADDGRIQKLGPQSINDHRYLLSTSAALYARSDFKRAARRLWEESFWLLGPPGAEAFDRVPAENQTPRSRAFERGGICVLRSERAHVIVDCAEIGMRGRGGHGHNDILGFELWLDGVNWVTDCGAYLYTASRDWRNRFRSTAFHNTIEVDGEEVNRFAGPDALWQLQYDAVPTNATLVASGDVDTFRGGHRGYERLASPVGVAREIALDRGRLSVEVRDTLTGCGTHAVASRFHLDPAVAASRSGPQIRLSRGDRELWIRLDPVDGLDWSIEPGWVSPSYGVKVPTTVVVWSGRVRLPLSLSAAFSTRPPA